jgi:pimeloyl-ACP methyl ester carboxylesterase
MPTVPLESSGKAQANGLNLYYEAFGNPTHPAVLLIMGLASQSLHWFPYFYEPIVQKGYYVIRFDNRDIGLSDRIPPATWATNPYTLEDMAKDTIGLLDALNIKTAHIIGASMGGMVAQRIAISHPSYVQTLTSMLSCVEASSLGFDPSSLPESDSTQPPPLELQLQFWKMLTGSRFPFDEQRYRELYQEGFVVRQGYNPHCLTHHFAAIQHSGSRMSELNRITAPTLVVHGTEDPLIPEAHAAVYAQQIPNATYLSLDGVGHEMPEGISPTVLDAIFDVFSKASNSVTLNLNGATMKYQPSDNIQSTFGAYAEAFNTLEPTEVKDFFNKPSMLMTSNEYVVMTDSDAVLNVFKKLMNELKDKDFKESKVLSLDIKQLSDNQGLIVGTAKRFDKADKEIEHFGFTYTLRKVDAVWKIIAGVLHDPI